MTAYRLLPGTPVILPNPRPGSLGMRRGTGRFRLLVVEGSIFLSSVFYTCCFPPNFCAVSHHTYGQLCLELQKHSSLWGYLRVVVIITRLLARHYLRFRLIPIFYIRSVLFGEYSNKTYSRVRAPASLIEHHYNCCIINVAITTSNIRGDYYELTISVTNSVRYYKVYIHNGPSRLLFEESTSI